MMRDFDVQEQEALHLEKPGSKKREVKQQIRGTLSTITPMKTNYSTKIASAMLIHRFNQKKKKMHAYVDILVKSTTLKFTPSPRIKLSLLTVNFRSKQYVKLYVVPILRGNTELQ